MPVWLIIDSGRHFILLVSSYVQVHSSHLCDADMQTVYTGLEGVLFECYPNKAISFFFPIIHERSLNTSTGSIMQK